MAEILVFDLDGTLLDSLADIQSALNTALSEQGLAEHDTESVRRMVGHGMKELVRQAVGATGTPHGPAVLSRMRQIYQEIPYRYSRPYPEVPQLLRFLAQRGHTLAVLTNKVDSIAQIIVNNFFGGIFSQVQGENPDWPRKPDPEALFRVLAKIEHVRSQAPLSREELRQQAVLIGDSEADIQTAAAAGVRAIGVAWGFRSPEQLLAAGAEQVVHDCQALAQALGYSDFLAEAGEKV